ncbi:hypothetical protein K443DRAFT_6780 [Laccaria amethystina LaAM-08-1]|uniref:ABC transporter domain-containing protein n=1 Tax=Laccaria amethystina LaAM-08-1 TaxID=1095629 RepID=A0A0C9XJF7_9AGAR|nr:hypothetical protein K443DRAFT_6780 [Laccaria amethystina LaAM-08-1]
MSKSMWMPEDNDIIIPIMGPTGAGKSTFINYIAGKKPEVAESSILHKGLRLTAEDWFSWIPQGLMILASTILPYWIASVFGLKLCGSPKIEEAATTFN